MRYALTGARIIDGTGSPPIDRGFLVVEGDRILAVETGEPGTFDGPVVDCSGKTLLPGLINCHSHLVGYDGRTSHPQTDREPGSWVYYRAVQNLQDTLRSGVTTVRDCGSRDDGNISLRDAVREGLLTGPDIVACGRLITITGGHGSWDGLIADGVDEVRKAVRLQLKRGADQIKIMATGGVTSGTNPGAAQYDEEELAVAVREAAKQGKIVAAHAHGTEGIKNALRAGIQSIEHGMFLDEEAVEWMVRQNTFLVPTLTAPWEIIHGNGIRLPPASVERAKRCMDHAFQSFRMARKAGIPIAMGTDAGAPGNYHHAAWKELALYVDHGMTPTEAIGTATKTAAQLLGVDSDRGTLEQGKRADFLLVAQNPLEDIRALSKVDAVYKNGREYTGQL